MHPPGSPNRAMGPKLLERRGWASILSFSMWALAAREAQAQSVVGPPLNPRGQQPLVIGGSVAAGTAYVTAVGAGIVACSDAPYMCERYGPLFIPLAGPFIALGTGVFDPDRDDAPWPGMQYAFVVDGTLQVAGTALLITGLVLQQDDTGADDRAASWQPTVSIAPRAISARWSF